MRRAVEIAVRSVKGFLADKCSFSAAAITYYTLLSIFPLLLFALGVMGFFITSEQDRQDLIDRIIEEVPLDEESGRDNLESVIDSVVSARGTFGIIGLVGLLYSGSALFTAIRNGLNSVFGREQTRNFIIGKLVDLGFVFLFGVVFLSSIAASFAISFLGRLATDVVGEDAAPLFSTGMAIAYFLVPPLVSFIGFFLLYRLIPGERPDTKHAAVGAIVAALGFEILKAGFTQYVAYFGNYNETYGVLGFLIIFLFFIYLAAQVMLFGAEVTAATGEVAPAWPLARDEMQSESIVSKIPGVSDYRGPEPRPSPAADGVVLAAGPGEATQERPSSWPVFAGAAAFAALVLASLWPRARD